MTRKVRLVSAVGLLACSAPPPPAPVAPRPLASVADPAEYHAYLQPGSFQLTGQAFLTTRGGDVKVAAGRLVTLDPATTYFREWFRRFGADAGSFEALPPDTLAASARRTTTANAEGRFRFSNLPAGDYIVRTTVTWETGAALAGLQGGVVAALVSVGPAADEVILNRVFTPDLATTLGVEVFTASQLSARAYRVIARVSGVSCQIGLIDPPPNADAAREDLVLRAARQGAAGVANVTCNRHGMSFRPNCMSRYQCDGDAIEWQ